MSVIEFKLRIGDMSENGQITIVDEDRLCYLVKSISKGAVGLRTISKALLDEFVTYMKSHPEVPANEVRFKISGQSDIDKYEYGYGATLVVMANMILGNTGIIRTSQSTNRTLLFQPCIESKEGINGFLDRAIPIVLERDADLYRLDKFANVDGGVYQTIGRHNLGRASDKDARPNDINPNIEWTCGLNGKRYYLNREVNYPNFVTFQEAFNEAYKGIFKIVIDTIDYNGAQRKRYSLYAVNSAVASTDIEDSPYRPYLTAIKSKPFLLLAGISGTGKSRIVRELAFMSCPKYLQDKDGVTPGNYCMIEVKPNWHDSTELLGYYSNISREYQFKKFVKFLVKAKMHPEVPFFVCLDEMNLAPVEQYFAEILSILETRKHPKTDEGVDMKTIKTEVLVEPQHFKYHSYKDESGAIREKLDMTDKDWYETFCGTAMMTEEERELINHYQYSRTLQQEGLSLPDNVIIIGTVNMDETTHQFSRKVIDRAMTIEMNGGRLVDMFGGSGRLEYLPEEQQQKWQAAFRQRYVCADEVLELHPEVANDIRTKLPARLEEINKALRGTPFEVSYRVLNELTIMVGVMLDDNAEGKDIDAIISEAIDNILLMKILPRVEGDSDMFELSGMEKKKHGVEHDNRLKWLLALAPEITVTEEEGANHRQTAKGKIQEMIDRLDSHEFTRYWP